MKTFIVGLIIGASVWANRYELVDLAVMHGPTAGDYIQNGVNNVIANINNQG